MLAGNTPTLVVANKVARKFTTWRIKLLGSITHGGNSVVPIFNVSRRKVGGIWFFRLGRISFTICVSRAVPRTFQWEEFSS